MVPPRVDERLQQILDLARGHRVDPFERLVEEQQPRRRQQRGRERQLLPHAVRKVRDERRAGRLQIHQLEQIAGAVPRDRGVESVDLGDEGQRFGRRQAIEERQILRARRRCGA